MNRYYWSTKSSVKSSISSNISNLESLFCQESESVLSSDLIEIEGPNMISCPAHFIKLIRVIKMLREIEDSVDNGDFISLEEKKD